MTIRITCQNCGTEKNASNFISLDANNNPILSTVCNNCIKKMENKTEKPIITEKKCIKCNEIKNAKLFNKSKETKDCLSSWCKECQAEYKKQYNEKNRDKINEYNRKNGYTTYAYQRKFYIKRKEKEHDDMLVPGN